MKLAATLEPKPGIPPTSGHLKKLLGQVRQNKKIVAIIRASHASNNASLWLAKKSNIPALVLPYTVGGNEQAKDLFGLLNIQFLLCEGSLTLSSEIFEIIGPALAAGLMISLSHAPLGLEVLRRGIIFIDLAVAQISGLFLIIASLVFHDPPWWLLQSIALSGATLSALAFRLVEKKLPRSSSRQEAIIGSSFVLAASLSLLLLADQTHGGEEIQNLLSGQILFVTWQDVLSHLPVYIFVLGLWFAKPELRKGLAFYLFFSLAITSSVQLVGVYVVFASLILSALAAIDAKRKHLSAWACGIFSVVIGMLAATAFDLVAGPMIVLGYTFTYIMVLSFRWLFR